MIRIALLSPSIDPHNGYGNFTFEYCQQLKTRPEIEFTLFLPVNAYLLEGNYGFQIRRELPPFFLSSRNPWRLMKYMLAPIVQEDDDCAYDLIHSLAAFPFALTAMGNAWRWRTPYIVSTQGTYAIFPLMYWPAKIFLKKVYQRATKVVAASEFTAKAILKHGQVQLPVQVIHNAINYERFQAPVDLRPLEERFPSRPVILSVGALKARKGQDLVLRALKIVRQRFPDAIYLCVGRGERLDYLESLARELGVANNTYFLTDVSYDELVGYYQFCDVYVHLPRNVHWHFEGFGLVFLEAGACGKPVVGTRSGGVPCAVIDGKTGILVPENDFEAAAEALINILANPRRAKEMGCAGREYAISHSWSALVNSYVQLYQDATKS